MTFGDRIPAEPLDYQQADPDAERKAENERFLIWEAGYSAGLHSARGQRRTNPYTFRGEPK